MQDAESAFGSDSSSVLEWKPVEPADVTSAPTTRKPLTALRVQVRRPSWLCLPVNRECEACGLGSVLLRRRTRTAAPTWATWRRRRPTGLSWPGTPPWGSPASCSVSARTNSRSRPAPPWVSPKPAQMSQSLTCTDWFLCGSRSGFPDEDPDLGRTARLTAAVGHGRTGKVLLLFSSSIQRCRRTRVAELISSRQVPQHRQVLFPACGRRAAALRRHLREELPKRSRVGGHGWGEPPPPPPAGADSVRD